MAINFEPKIGQILECNYGGYQYDENAWLSLEGLKRTSCLSAIPARPFQLESQLLADSCRSRTATFGQKRTFTTGENNSKST